MKHHPISNWAALLLTISGMAASPLSAAPKVVNTDQSGITDTDGVYESVGGTAALYVYSPGASYSGSNITLSSTFSGNIGRAGAYINNNASVSLSGGTITTTGTTGVGLYLNGTSSGTARDLNVSTSGDNSAHAVQVSGASTLLLASSTLTVGGSGGQGINITGTSTVVLDDVQIATAAGPGIYVATSTLTADHVQITATSIYGIRLTATSSLTASDLNLNVSGLITQNSAGLSVEGESTATVSGLTITKTSGAGVRVITGSASATLSDVDITVTSGSEASGIYVGDAGVLTATNVRIMVAGGAHNDGLRFGGDHGSAMTLTNADVAVTSSNSQVIYIAPFKPGGAEEQHTLVINGGRLSASQGTVIAVNPQSKEYYDLDGYSTLQCDSEITLRDVIMSGTSALEITSIRSGTWSDGTVGTVDMPTNFILHTERATINGDANFHGSSTSTLNLADSTLTGNVSGNDHAIVDLTVSGSHSALFGDIAQNDNAVVTITIDNGATGSGGYHGGNLITGGDSAWTFDKDSHGNYGENNGVWNIGDYEVIFDNLTNTGTVNLNVNSDTGAGGTIITGTADGDGKVHIDTTGNGQLNPNDVLPGIVSGDGTEHWQWDPIDWGIDTIIKDGDHFVKSGVSPAGALLNSSVAIQQAMWFAQQNSLLKRMGELR
ncbi:MAG: hypothetical protein LBK71_00820 [Verrucomicrobiales bacterium]|nr:hypothetical protein [Verrucomicrobiales bacterium]